MTSTQPPAQHATAQQAPARPAAAAANRAGVLALFRADLSNYSRRWSTWVPLLLALALGALMLAQTLTMEGPTDGPPRRVTPDDLTVALGALSVVVAGGTGYLAGAAWMGFEHTSGALGTWLTFNPRRLRVWLSRLTVAVAFPTLLALTGLLAAGVPALFDGEAAAEWSQFFWPYLIVAASFGALGFSIASLGRHMLWALGAFAGYAAVAVLTEELPSYGDEPYLLHVALGDFLEGPRETAAYRAQEVLGMAPHLAGGVVWVTFTVLVVAVALIVFRRSSID